MPSDCELLEQALPRLIEMRDEAVMLALRKEGRVPSARARHYFASWTPRPWWYEGQFRYAHLLPGSNKPVIRVRASREH